MAKFEEVIAHLKDGGKVRVQGGLGNPELDLDALIRSYTTKDMFYNLDYIIIEKPYKDIWYNELYYLDEIEEHLGIFI